jgi:lipopolysaccharide/colanic/teichoic acid biosynthesis glycosyltransferase
MNANADAQGPVWNVDDDPRVTKIGKLLRRTALDELPEILSIWKGDMSFVGPRALAVEEQEDLEMEIPGFEQRLRARPGLTGLAQVYNPTDDSYLKLKFDLDYMENMSLWLDLKLIILSTRNTLLAKWDKRSGKMTRKP